MKNFIRREQFPYMSALGWEYDSGDYHTALQKAMDAVGYAELRAEQKAKQEAFKRGETRELMGIGVAFFTEIVGAGPSRNCDILGVAHVRFAARSASIRPGSAIARLGTKSQGQGHETTYAQILATEIGIPSEDIMIEEGNTDTAPYGLGTYGSRSTPVAGAADGAWRRARSAPRPRRSPPTCSRCTTTTSSGTSTASRSRAMPEKQFKTMKEIAWAAYTTCREGMEPGPRGGRLLRPAQHDLSVRRLYLRRSTSTVETGETKVRRFYALDDCGTRINPMIIEGQVHGGLTEAFGIAMGQEIVYDETGNVQGASFMDYFLPTAVETPKWETDFTVTPSPHHPIGAKGVGESPNVGGVLGLLQRGHRRLRASRRRPTSPMPHDHWRTWTVAEKLRAA